MNNSVNMIMKYFIKRKKLDFNVKLLHYPLLHVYKDVMHSLQVSVRLKITHRYIEICTLTQEQRSDRRYNEKQSQCLGSRVGWDSILILTTTLMFL